jgi:hypothetical protein
MGSALPLTDPVLLRVNAVQREKFGGNAMAKPGRRAKPKTDQSSIPPAPGHLTEEERKHYKSLVDDLNRSAFAAGIDAKSICLAASRLARLDLLRRLWGNLPESEYWITTENGATKAHPLFAEIRHGERAVDLSLTQLFLTPKSRSSSRIGGVRDVDPALEAMTEGQKKLLKYLA